MNMDSLVKEILNLNGIIPGKIKNKMKYLKTRQKGSLNYLASYLFRPNIVGGA